MSSVGGVERLGDAPLPEAPGAWMRFAVGGEELAVPGSVVREVASAAEVSADDRAPDGVLGFLARRGHKIPVFDLGAFLQVPASRVAEGHVLVVLTAGRCFGLRVTRVFGLTDLALQGMRPLPPSARSGPANHLFFGAYPREDRWLLLFDVDQFFSVAAEALGFGFSR